MPRSPEKEPRFPVVERVEEFELPPHLSPEETGIRTVETAFKARVKDKGKHLIQTSATKKITIKLPAGQATVSTWAKGKTTNSLTWLGAYWERMIEKAKYFGWKIVGGKEG
jgi:hypothetical protein